MTQRGRSANPPRSSQAAVSPSIHPSIHRHSGSGRVQEDDDDSLFTQPTTSQVQRGLEKLTPAQVERKTAEVVQFILVKDQKKFPIRRADLIRVVLKEYKNIYPEVMKRAARTFEQVFGLRLMEIDPKNHLYILQNNLEPVGAASPVMKPCSSKTGLLWVILSVIFMKGGVVRESVIWNILKKLRVQPGEKHSEFGEVKKVVTEEFVRQRYLEYVRVPHTEPLEHDFCWGQRAVAEVSKAKILEFMAELHQQDPKSWSQQYREAQASSPRAGTSSQR
ncbi:non-structural maintenance of chromosomes element 3 homolog isoform X4 [Takifugu rubripes]|uniref:non-structural maintenance of chromosomes element 3 homolog isoform X3 n=1 Tax=Takifugu rubripes TaxID=31033 RepID=UPI0011458DA0|nr:non-structural maintenance of chromosomes element 3 homolog isoform X3 [Takifugu rubripes]XP_029690299.1 non-structural maintenance of chromosomes element 3 homolog isoform X4 [Takifugu rubripes]